MRRQAILLCTSLILSTHAFAPSNRFQNVALTHVLVRQTASSRQDDGGVSKRRFLPSFLRPRLERQVDKLFDKADTNKDGTVDMTEAYEMVLRMYIKLNQKAPIPPPSRDKVYTIFRKSDANFDNQISRSEFTSLVRVLSRRAMARLVAHRLVTLVAAPLLATELIQILRQQPFIRRKVPKYAAYLIPDHLEAELMSASFARTALIIVFVATLGNFAIGIVNFLLDLSIREYNDEKEES